MIRSTVAVLLLTAPIAVAEPVMRFDVGGSGFDLEPEDILQAEAEPTDLGAVLFFRFAAAPSRALRDLTEESIGKQMDLIVCGQVLVSPLVMDVIAGGVGQVNLGGLDDARTLASVLHGDVSCPEYRGG